MKKILLLIVIVAATLIGILFTKNHYNYVYLVIEAEMIEKTSTSKDFTSAVFKVNNREVIYSYHKTYDIPNSRGQVSIEEGKTYSFLIRKNGLLRPDNEIIRLNPDNKYYKYIEGGVLE